MNAECKAEEYDMKMVRCICYKMCLYMCGIYQMENTKKRQEIVAKNSDLKQEIAALQYVILII